MPGPRLILSVAFGLLVVGVLIQQQLTLAGLRRELDALRGPSAPPENNGTPGRPASGASGAPASGGERTELVRLRDEVNELRARTAALAQQAARGAPGSTPLDLRPASAWRQSGKATPSDAAESLFWAADSGDLNLLANSIVLDPAAKEKAEAILARLPLETRTAYDTPEKLIALLLARDVDARAMQILGENKAGDDALVNLRLQKDDGKTKDEGYQFRRTSDGWRLVIPGKAVDKFGKKLTNPPKKDSGK